MTELFYMGGPLFMGILTIILIAAVAAAANSFIRIKKGADQQLSLVKEIGIFGLIVGVLGQTIGLYSAFSTIEQAGMIAPEILIAGLRVSSITTMYGLIILAIGYLMYFGLRAISSKTTVQTKQ